MDSTIAALSSISNLQTSTQIAAAVLKKQNELMKQQGEMALQLIQSVATPSAPSGSLGHNIDVYA